jgi:uncharacterized CHY-type Zn-finger protein
MGMEKDRLIEREQNARLNAQRNGDMCGYCMEPLLTAEERTRGSCARCEHNLNKDD